MDQTNNKSFLSTIFRNRFQFMLITLLLYIVLVPFISDFVRIRNLLDIFFLFILISSIYAVSEKAKETVIATVLIVPLIFFIWVAPFFQFPNAKILGTMFEIIFLGFVIFSLLSFVFRQKIITQEVISASISAYLLLGIAWALVYFILEKIHPGSFGYEEIPIENLRMIFMYYSYVTLTTLGYGDITPLTARATSLSVTEAIIGQLFLTVLIARLIGLHISQSTKDKN